jgi:hypothetical protein
MKLMGGKDTGKKACLSNMILTVDAIHHIIQEASVKEISFGVACHPKLSTIC